MVTLRRIALTSLLLACAACAAPRQVERTPVPEGINDGFLSDEVNVDDYVGRWELESREIYVAKDAIAELLELDPGDAVADIGTGTGLFVEPFAAAVGPTGTVHALDISPAFVAHVRRRVTDAGLDQVRPGLSSPRSIGLPSRSVDVAFLSDVYHHFEYHEDMLRSIRSALRPGGLLVLVDFERIPGVTREWLMNHVRAGKDVVRAEIEAAGFTFLDEPDVPGLDENYCLRFRR
jgi:predicted methyltransferase